MPQSASALARQVGLILAAASPATSLALIPGLEPALAAADYRLIVITAPRRLTRCQSP
jgi:hypothetical protein